MDLEDELYSPYWETEEFEDLVARGLIAMYESKIKINKRSLPATRLNDELMHRIKRIGCYFPSNDRVMFIEQSDDGRAAKKQIIDSINDGRPDFCLWSTRANNLWEKGYLQTFYMEHIHSLPKPFKTDFPGKIYRVVALNFNEQVTGICDYVTINSKGEIRSVYRPVNYHHPITGRTISIKDLPQSDTENAQDVITLWAAATLQIYQDRRFLWNVKAKEGIAKATFAVHPEQIKSLFYARDLPMTESGRKRPILHWVKSHQRRMKEGTDIDVEKYLRGTHEFVYNNTKFEITNPIKKRLDTNQV
jgi:hypothetical protein